MRPGYVHCQYVSTCVVCDGKAQGAEQVEPKEVGTMARHLEGECWESSGAVAYREGGGAHHADLSVSIAIQILHACLDCLSGKEPPDCGLTVHTPC